MKNLRLIYILLLFASCTKVLDQVPEYTIADENFWQTGNDAESAAVGIYPAIQSMAAQFPLAFDAGSDATTALLINYSPFSTHGIPVDNLIVAAYWQNNYTGIGRANDLLKHVPPMKDSLFAPGRKEQLLGEAHFLRAYFYFNLVKAYGAVPLVLEPYTSFNADFTVPRTSVDSIFKQIIADLKIAEASLPPTFAAAVTTRGRASQGGAKALLAKAYLSIKDYNAAASKALEVMNSPVYSLVSGSAAYSGMFSTSGKNSTEAIFEIQYVSASAQSNGLYSYYIPANGIPAGLQTGGYQIAPTTKIINAYEDGDIRKTAALGFNNATPALPYVNKYTRLTNGTEPDIIALRLADIILVRAEALNNLGQTADAVAALNIIRRRAFGLPTDQPSAHDYPQAGETDLALAIENERFKELAFEGHRFYDLVRTGRATAVLGITADQTLWPIPLREIGRNPRLVQNNGY
ncbi:RagB/SusD family nutrient uptake outer membrane protein [Chitinophaga polysaccharea]|uniref:RagB/SusD family nutrient uptake outer membrane protein n=1 Tax=Chitinophaga TaxID=79328 RepID=UPI0014551B44|nr:MULTISPECIES: RagB/SusD family nutrient uptake outer membrane protein [Chitinophaga]NLR62358.1 RagB/SusD family nutrient uptake outer membrane protein [Chitinophaga polysaccharea]NLU92469.1 RagB/SusD family nutrient uptake outer membrane protein [Chitinophaga sp. Ak27]